MADSITIMLEDGARRVPAACTLAQLVADLGHEAQRVSTAVNGQFVPRSARAARRLQAGDVVTIFQAIVGG